MRFAKKGKKNLSLLRIVLVIMEIRKNTVIRHEILSIHPESFFMPLLVSNTPYSYSLSDRFQKSTYSLI